MPRLYAHGITVPSHRRRARPNRASRPLLTLALVAAATGCGSQEAVRHYRVPKPELVYAANHVRTDSEAAQSPATPAARTDRLLGAVVPHGDETWYFKMTGPLDAVATQALAFRQLIESVEFDGDQGRPRWQLPEAWQERPGTGQRLATLTVSVDGQTLEVSVISLASGPSNNTLLDNVNRWRGQMGLMPITAEQLPDETLTLELPHGTATLVNLIGQFQDAAAANISLQRDGSDPVHGSAPANNNQP